MSENLKQFFNLLANNPEIKEKALACNELGKDKVAKIENKIITTTSVNEIHFNEII